MYYKRPYDSNSGRTTTTPASQHSYKYTRSHRNHESEYENDYNHQVRTGNRYIAITVPKPTKTEFESRGGINPYAIANYILAEEDEEEEQEERAGINKKYIDLEYGGAGRKIRRSNKNRPVRVRVPAYVPQEYDYEDYEEEEEVAEAYESTDNSLFCNLFLKFIIIMFVLMLGAVTVLFFRVDLRPKGSEIVFKPIEDNVSNLKVWIDDFSGRLKKST